MSWLADGRRIIHLSGKPGCRWATGIPLGSGISEELLSRFLKERSTQEQRIGSFVHFEDASGNSRTQPLPDILFKRFCTCIKQSLVGRIPAGRHRALARTSVEEAPLSARVPAMVTHPLAVSFWPAPRLHGCPVAYRRTIKGRRQQGVLALCLPRNVIAMFHSHAKGVREIDMGMTGIAFERINAIRLGIAFPALERKY